MKIAIVGAGFAGLSLCYHLQSSLTCSVTVYDKKGIAGGASGIASGLVHPYVGEEIRRSLMADEALQETKYLLEVASHYSEEPLADFSGIERIAQNEKQLETMFSHTKNYTDITHVEEKKFLIHSGITVQTNPYLQALGRACIEKGAIVEQKEIHSLKDLQGYDAVVVAAGVGIFGFEEFSAFRLDTTRGQSLTCRWPLHLPALKKSLIGKGYLAKGSTKEIISAGATYERGRRNEEPDLSSALKTLAPKMETLYPGLVLDPIEVKAGVRVSSIGHYFPLIGKVSDGLWAMTGLGSRGLLYHGLFGKMLARGIMDHDESHFPDITKLLLSKNRELSYNRKNNNSG